MCVIGYNKSMKTPTVKITRANDRFEIWARAIREEIKPDEDGDVRAISAVIASFTRLVYPSEIKIFMDWCGKNGYQDLCDEFNTWHF